MQFFDVHEHTKYMVEISRPESIDQLSDYFMSEDELKDMIGGHFYCPSTNTPRKFLCNDLITKELENWAAKKTLIIEDEDLVDVLKTTYVSYYIDEKYGRHGNRICYARRYKRKKKKPTKGDVREFWIRIFSHAFMSKFGAWPPYFSTYDRHLSAFKAWQKVLGWKACSKHMHDPVQKKFFKMIWDNPEEYV